MTPKTHIVVILSTGLSETVTTSFLKDLSRYKVYDAEEFSNENTLVSRVETSNKKVVCVCSAEACYTLLGKTLCDRQPSNLLGLLLFCGPHEDFYSRWASSCPAVKFLSHNLKEVRRAVIWFLAGGEFNSNGEAIPPPSTKLVEANRLSRPPLQAINDIRVHDYASPLETKNYKYETWKQQNSNDRATGTAAHCTIVQNDRNSDHLAQLVALWHLKEVMEWERTKNLDGHVAWTSQLQTNAC